MINLRGSNLTVKVKTTLCFQTGFVISEFADQCIETAYKKGEDFFALHVHPESVAALNLTAISRRERVTFDVVFPSGETVILKDGIVEGAEILDEETIAFYFTFNVRTTEETNAARQRAVKEVLTMDLAPSGATLH
jgi:hypothetical protein